MEQDKQLVHHRLYRDHCVEVSPDFFVKDLRILNRDLRNVIIVDNTPYAFAAQLENGYPIIPFYNDDHDTQLLELEEYLMNIKDVEDVRIENSKRFKLKDMTEHVVDKYAQYYKGKNEEDMKKIEKIEESEEFMQLKESLKTFFKS